MRTNIKPSSTKGLGGCLHLKNKKTKKNRKKCFIWTNHIIIVSFVPVGARRTGLGAALQYLFFFFQVAKEAAVCPLCRYTIDLLANAIFGFMQHEMECHISPCLRQSVSRRCRSTVHMCRDRRDRCLVAGRRIRLCGRWAVTFIKIPLRYCKVLPFNHSIHKIPNERASAVLLFSPTLPTSLPSFPDWPI